MGQPEKRTIAVGIVGADDASVDTGFLAYNEIRASLWRDCIKHEAQKQKKSFIDVHTDILR